MNTDKIFENLGEINKDLWDRINAFSEVLAEASGDSHSEMEYLTRDESAKFNCMVNNFIHNSNSIGAHLARVTKEKKLLENEKDKLFGKLYGEVTDKCVADKNSSKYDQQYRTGKVLINPEYQKILKIIAEVTELELLLKTVENSQKAKSYSLNTLIKTDINGY